MLDSKCYIGKYLKPKQIDSSEVRRSTKYEKSHKNSKTNNQKDEKVSLNTRGKQDDLQCSNISHYLMWRETFDCNP